MGTPGGDAKRLKVEHSPEEQMDVDASDQGADAAEEDDLSSMDMRVLMQRYYTHLFPAQHMHKWLCYGNDGRHAQADATFSQRREICFTLDGDIFVRYQSFKGAQDFAAALRQKVPSKIDIGPVYTHDPRERAKYAKDFKPVERELVFDIDLTDYDDVRTCGKGGHICSSCWPLMGLAIEVLDEALRSDFGFKHILWVYSGRRGVHCWVCDDSARKLKDESRYAIVQYMSVIRGTEADKAKLAMGISRHPALERAYQMLTEAWTERVLPQQHLLEDAETMPRVLQYLADDELAEQLRKRWAAGGLGLQPKRHEEPVCLSVARWRELVQEVEYKAAKASGKIARKLNKSVSDIVFAFTYPRLDVEVSKKMNHLLKAPFCVHPKTGKVCVPINPSAAWEFDPDGVPTVQQLLRQLPQHGEASVHDADGWRSTAMAEPLGMFETAFLEPLEKEQRALLNARAREVREQRQDASW